MNAYASRSNAIDTWKWFLRRSHYQVEADVKNYVMGFYVIPRQKLFWNIYFGNFIIQKLIHTWPWIIMNSKWSNVDENVSNSAIGWTSHPKLH